MFEEILVLLLKTKFHVITAAKIPLIAALLVLGSTGFIVTGTISGDDGEQTVNLTVKPLESTKCIDALIAQTETLLRLDLLAADATSQLGHMSERARENADEQHKLLDDVAVLKQVGASSTEIGEALAAARQEVFAAANLDKCKDRDPNTSVDLDVDNLRATYDKILLDFGKKLNGILTDAQKAFDTLVANAPLKPRPIQDKSGGSHSSD
jgi:hypothetical protein